MSHLSFLGGGGWGRGLAGRNTYPAGGGEGAVDIEEADGVLQRTILQRRVAENHGGLDWIAVLCLNLAKGRRRSEMEWSGMERKDTGKDKRKR